MIVFSIQKITGIVKLAGFDKSLRNTFIIQRCTLGETMKQKCFFTYCWDDPDFVQELMGYMKKQLEEKSNYTIKVTIDKESLHTSENFKEFEKQIRKSDSVVVFFSPNYKKVVESGNAKRGVFREYQLILEEYKNNNISVIPIVVTGGIKNSITDDFKDSISADFSGLEPLVEINGRRKGKKLNPKLKTKMKNLITDILFETSISHRRKEYVFSSKEEAYTVLFCNTDSKDKLPRVCMYKSEAYNNIMSEEGTSFLVGRKGSGKTTFFEVLEKYDTTEFDKKFKVLRPISVEDIREENIYSVFLRFHEDTKIFGQGRVIELFWEIYIFLCSIYIVCVEEENHRIRDNRQSKFHKISVKLRKAFNVQKLDSTDVKRAIFTESVSLWEIFLNETLLDYATEEAFLASMDANFNANNVMSRLFGRRDYNELISCIEQCDKKILVALDRFDAISDDFRRKIKNDLNATNDEIVFDAKKRAEFDGLLYRSLITTVEKLKTIDSGIMGNVMFCIIIPQDRIDQIRMTDRDFAKRKFIGLSWDAMELLNVVLLRLSFLFDTELNYQGDIVIQFQDIMLNCMPTIPLNIKIDVNGTSKEIDLFQYLLRISFWRPRDIIKYFAVLYDANQKNKNKHKEIDMDTLKALLNNVTDEIIEDEFYNEYNKTFYNIESLIEKFEHKNILLSIEEFIAILCNFDFKGIIFDSSDEIIEKIKMLYEIGIIGLIFNPDYIKRKGICSEVCFVFNEGMNPFNNSKKEISQRNTSIKIVINPIFSKKISLHYNTSKIIGAYGWDYLRDNHARKMTIKRI